MSIIPPSIIKVYAETLGITNLSDDASTTLSQDLEYRIREVIQDAYKFMIHSKRQKLSVDDINAALKLRNFDPLYGFEPTEPLAFRAVPNTGLFYVPNEELDVESILQDPLPPAPQPMCLTSHWLAIEGVQPQIPQNPTARDRNVLGEAVTSSTPVISKAKESLSDDAEVKPLVKHVLSKELQLYYDTLISDLLSTEAESAEYSAVTLSAISALKNDAGIQQLLPYFIQFVAETVPKSLGNGSRLRMTMDVTGSLLHNAHLFVEPYLHQLMPPILTCVVGKRLGEAGFDHWALRVQAAELVAFIAKSYGNTYISLIPRITKTLARSLSTSSATSENESSTEIKPLTTHFGAIVALSLLGSDVIESVLLPMLEEYLRALPNFERLGLHDEDKVRGALKGAAELWMKEKAAVSGDEKKMQLMKSLI